MKLTANLIARTETKSGRHITETFVFTEHQGMLNVTYSKIGGGADPTFLCYRFNDRRQGNAFYIALKRLGAIASTAESLASSQESGLRYVRNVMRDGVRPFDELLASLIISGYLQVA